MNNSRRPIRTTPVTTKSSSTKQDNDMAPKQIKKGMIDTKANATSLKIRSKPPRATANVPSSISIRPERSNDTTSRLSSVRPFKIMSEASHADGDEEILDELYCMYLQRRLLAQCASKAMRQELNNQTEETTQLFLKLEFVPKNVFAARLSALRRIEKQVSELEKVKSLQENLDLLLELITTDSSKEYTQNFQDKLSAVGDLVSTTNSNSKYNDEPFDLTPVEQNFKELNKDTEIPDSALHVITSLSENVEVLQKLGDTFKCDEKELNDKIVQLASLKESQQLLNNPLIVRRQQH